MEMAPSRRARRWIGTVTIVALVGAGVLVLTLARESDDARTARGIRALVAGLQGQATAFDEARAAFRAELHTGILDPYPGFLLSLTERLREPPAEPRSRLDQAIRHVRDGAWDTARRSLQDPTKGPPSESEELLLRFLDDVATVTAGQGHPPSP